MLNPIETDIRLTKQNSQESFYLPVSPLQRKSLLQQTSSSSLQGAQGLQKTSSKLKIDTLVKLKVQDSKIAPFLRTQSIVSKQKPKGGVSSSDLSPHQNSALQIQDGQSNVEGEQPCESNALVLKKSASTRKESLLQLELPEQSPSGSPKSLL